MLPINVRSSAPTPEDMEVDNPSTSSSSAVQTAAELVSVSNTNSLASLRTLSLVKLSQGSSLDYAVVRQKLEESKEKAQVMVADFATRNDDSYTEGPPTKRQRIAEDAAASTSASSSTAADEGYLRPDDGEKYRSSSSIRDRFYSMSMADRANLAIVKPMVEQCINLYYDLPPELKAHPDIVNIQLSYSLDRYRLLPEEVQQSKEVLIKVIPGHASVYLGLPTHLLLDRELALIFMQHHPFAFGVLPIELRSDPVFIAEVMLQQKSILIYHMLPEQLKQHPVVLACYNLYK